MSEPDPSVPEIRIRMTRCGDQTLNGYIFTNDDHARKWLRSYQANDANVTIERVEVGPLTRCRSCGGDGFRQSVKKIENVNLVEFLNHG